MPDSAVDSFPAAAKPLTTQQLQRKRLGGANPDAGAICHCNRPAEAKCVCGANFCARHWWRHSHTSNAFNEGGAR